MLAFAASAQGIESAKVIRVLDGATIVLTNGEVVSYAGVRIPEAEVGNAERATAFNESLVGGADVRLEYDVEKRDAAGRLLAYVYVGRFFVNKELVDLGFAEVDTETRNIKYRKLFFRIQKEAFERRRGLWAERFGEEGAERVEAPEMPGLEVPEAVAAAGLPVSLPAEERPLGAVDLVCRYFIGDVLTYRGTLTRTLAFAEGETQREDSVELTVEVVWTIEDVDAKGGATIRQDIVSIGASTISDRISQEDVERMGQLAGRSVTTTVDGKGYVVRVSGIDQLLAGAPPAFHSLLRGIFWNETPLPGRAVGLGDFWWVERTVPFSSDGTQVNLRMDAKCIVTDFARVRERGCAEVYMEGTLGLQGAGAEGSEPAGAAEGEMRRTFYVAYDDGLVARSEGESEVVFAPSAVEGTPGRVVVTERAEFVVQEIRRGENYVALGAVPTEAARTAYVARDVVNLRGAATTRSRVLTRLERGQRLTVLARKGDWYKVEYSYPLWGWISAKLVEGEISEDLLLQIAEKAAGWEEPSAIVAESAAPPEMREKEVFYASLPRRALRLRGWSTSPRAIS
jgi:micrococcal nuclease